jgi:hypothetical protein
MDSMEADLNFRTAIKSPSEESSKFRPRQAVKDIRFFQSRSARLIDSVTNQSKFTGAMRIGGDSDLYVRGGGRARIVRRKIEAIRTGIYFEKAAVLPGMSNDPFNIYFVSGAFKKEAAGCMTQNIEIPVVHGAHDSLSLLLLAERETGMN